MKNDRFGNRNFDTGTTILSNESSITKIANPEILTTNNRFKLDQDSDSVNDYEYDSSGNLTKNAQGRNFAFNAENLQTAATGSGLSFIYSYDGNNKRVKSHDAVNDKTTIFVYDASGVLAAEYTINVTPPTTPVISYTTDDALGSPRIVTNSFAEVKSRRDFLPFGEELYAGITARNTNQKYSSSTDDTRKKFATYQRDAETGLDFAQSRYYSPMHGRFTSPDEFKGGPDELFDFEEDAANNPTLYADLTNPQSLNKYQYAYNNPYKFNDPTGHCPPLVIAGVVIVMACLANPDYAVAPTGRETAEEMKSYRTTYGSNALLDLIPGGRGTSLFRNIFTKTAVRKTTTTAATKTIVTPTKTVVSKTQKPGSRPGKPFTKKGKDIVKTKNAEKNSGANKCENCAVNTTKPKKTEKGDKRAKTETQVDHIKSKKKGGSGTPENGQVLCFDCNLKKGSND